MIALVAGMAAFAASAAEYSMLSCDVSALPSEKRFVAEMLQSRVEARTAPSGAAKQLAVRFVLDDAVKGESAIVTVKDGRAAICAGRFRGLRRSRHLDRITVDDALVVLLHGIRDRRPAKALRAEVVRARRTAAKATRRSTRETGRNVRARRTRELRTPSRKILIEIVATEATTKAAKIRARFKVNYGRVKFLKEAGRRKRADVSLEEPAFRMVQVQLLFGAGATHIE